MAKNFPYFKFTATEWLTGDIVFETLNVQGLFINICALYWQRDGKLTIDEVNKRYNNPKELDVLSDRYISVSDRYISVQFLDEQLIHANHISKINSENGKLGGEAAATAKRILANKKREEEQEEEKNKKFVPPSSDEVKAYFKANGYTEESGMKAYCYYEVAKWQDSNGKKIKNWKQKMQGVWFTQGNKERKKITIQ